MTPGVGVYQATPPDYPFEPLTPSSRFARPFLGIQKTEIWTPPPDPTKPGYEQYVKQVMEKGVRTNSTRTAFETQVGAKSSQWSVD
jgi:hypothetical protein